MGRVGYRHGGSCGLARWGGGHGCGCGRGELALGSHGGCCVLFHSDRVKYQVQVFACRCKRSGLLVRVSRSVHGVVVHVMKQRGGISLCGNELPPQADLISYYQARAHELHARVQTQELTSCARSGSPAISCLAVAALPSASWFLVSRCGVIGQAQTTWMRPSLRLLRNIRA